MSWKVSDSKIRQFLSDQARLDDYLQSICTPAEIGLFYERYIGYLYESDGYRVEYSGIKNGFDDLGRDLIARKGNDVLVIQCKRWSKSKIIHEKHIYQLFGTSTHMQFEKKRKVCPVFVTSGSLSHEAQAAAKDLGVKLRFIPLNRKYPMVKCNINHLGKLYHLPFGKWYDSVQINTRAGDYFVSSIEEALKLGFSSAYLYKRSA